MIGKSYDGTIANGVAATGVEGLETIVPIGAISSWYDYYFAKGAPLYDSGPDWLSDYVESPDARARCAAVQQKLVDGAPRTGDWTRLWTERDYVQGRPARSTPASSSSTACRTSTSAPSTSASGGTPSPKHGVERKIWLSQTGHVDPFDFRRAEWVDTLHRWFDHELLGYDNGIDDEPMADIERAPDQWATTSVWPPRGTDTASLRPGKGEHGRASAPSALRTRPGHRDLHRRPGA